MKPERRTKTLYEQIRADNLSDADLAGEQLVQPAAASLPEVLGRLRRLQLILAAVQKRVQRDIKAVEVGLKSTKQ